MLTREEEAFISFAPFYIPALFDIHFEHNFDTIKPYGHIQTFPKGHVFLYPEQFSNTLYFLTKGIVAETTSNANGLEKMSLLFPCYPISLYPAIHKQPVIYRSSAYTAVEVITISYADYLQLMQQDLSLLENTLRLTALETRNANNSLLQSYASSTTEKIYQTLYLYDLTAKHYAPLAALKLSQQLLASLSGVHRTSVNNAIKHLKEEHIIDYVQKTLTVLQPQKLKELAFVQM